MNGLEWTGENCSLLFSFVLLLLFLFCSSEEENAIEYCSIKKEREVGRHQLFFLLNDYVLCLLLFLFCFCEENDDDVHGESKNKMMMTISLLRYILISRPTLRSWMRGKKPSVTTCLVSSESVWFCYWLHSSFVCEGITDKMKQQRGRVNVSQDESKR